MALRPKHFAQGLALALVAGLLVLLIWKLAHGTKANLGAGKTVPGFTLARLDTPGKLSLASLKGKAVVLNFWASWCVPCKQEAPLLESAWRRWRPRGVVVLGVDSEDFSKDAQHFMRKHDVTYPVVRDGSGALTNSYGLTGYPETFFVDRKGRLTKHVVGQLKSTPQLDEAVRESLSG
jgi:cytochrome c biogenesis protein CcmG/thiol:disulfide interchange protein DsbE